MATLDIVPAYPMLGDRPIFRALFEDVIDIDYDYHHKVSDTIDKVSAKSMRIVGDVAMALLRP